MSSAWSAHAHNSEQCGKTCQELSFLILYKSRHPTLLKLSLEQSKIYLFKARRSRHNLSRWLRAVNALGAVHALRVAHGFTPDPSVWSKSSLVLGFLYFKLGHPRSPRSSLLPNVAKNGIKKKDESARIPAPLYFVSPIQCFRTWQPCSFSCSYLPLH